MDGIHILGPDIISPVITLEAEHLGAYDLGVLLANRGIAVRCGAHCAYPLIRRMGDKDIKTELYRIGGCKTAIWLRTEETKGRVKFTGDSDSLLVKGVLAILDKMYNLQYIQDVKGHPPEFPDYISDEVIYPEIKQNGILKCYQRLAALSLN